MYLCIYLSTLNSQYKISGMNYLTENFLSNTYKRINTNLTQTLLENSKNTFQLLLRVHINPNTKIWQRDCKKRKLNTIVLNKILANPN